MLLQLCTALQYGGWYNYCGGGLKAPFTLSMFYVTQYILNKIWHYKTQNVILHCKKYRLWFLLDASVHANLTVFIDTQPQEENKW